jgi:hypothetical protein
MPSAICGAKHNYTVCEFTSTCIWFVGTTLMGMSANTEASTPNCGALVLTWLHARALFKTVLRMQTKHHNMWVHCRPEHQTSAEATGSICWTFHLEMELKNRPNKDGHWTSSKPLAVGGTYL